jgi:hypothetical protein
VSEFIDFCQHCRGKLRGRWVNGIEILAWIPSEQHCDPNDGDYEIISKKELVRLFFEERREGV